MFFAIAVLIVIFAIFNWYRRSLKIPHYSSNYVLITGCDSGFGNLLTKKLDRLGLNVFAGCLTQDGKENLRKATSNRVTVLDLDVTNLESIVNTREEVMKYLPYDRGLWGLVNNAGIAGIMMPIDFLNVDDYKNCNAVNLYGMIAVTKEFLPLVQKEKGRIVNITSMMGRIAATAAPYVVSKFGAEGFSDRLRIECYRYGVTVHILEPGFFNTTLVNFEKFFSDTTQRFNTSDESLKKKYGPTYFKEVTEVAKAGITTFLNINKVSWVVDAYAHALTAKYPKARYVVGVDANTLYRFLWTVPEWMSDYIQTRKAPLPDSLKKNKS